MIIIIIIIMIIIIKEKLPYGFRLFSRARSLLWHLGLLTLNTNDDANYWI